MPTHTRAYPHAQRPERLLLTIADVMETLRLSRTGVYKLIETGQLRPLYLDNRPRFALEDVEQLVRAYQQPGAAAG